jgi:zinc protease
LRHSTRTIAATLLLVGLQAAPALAVVAAGGLNQQEESAKAKKAAPAKSAAPRLSAPAPKPTPATPRLNVKEHKLKNGLRILMLEDHKAPVVTVQVWYQVGSKDERPGITGVSHLLEHMMFQGAKKYGTGQFDRTLTRLGGQNNAFTTEDLTAYHELLSSDHMETAFDLEADRMMGALIPPEKLKSEVNVVKEERRWRTENSPIGAVWETLGATAFMASAYHWPVVGWMSDLEQMTHQQVVDYYRAYYRPDNALLVVVGDFKAVDAVALAEKHFGGLPAAGGFVRNTTTEPPQEGERRAELVKQIETPVVMAGYHVPKAGHPDLYALDLLDTILSSGQSSRLYQELVYKGRVAQQVGSGLSENKEAGLFYLYALPMPGKTTQDLEKALYAQIDRLKSQPVTDQELQKALNVAESSFIFGQEAVESLAESIGTRASLTRVEDLNEYLPRLRAVTKQDIMRVASTYLVQTNRTVVTMRPGEEKK